MAAYGQEIYPALPPFGTATGLYRRSATNCVENDRSVGLAGEAQAQRQRIVL